MLTAITVVVMILIVCVILLAVLMYGLYVHFDARFREVEQRRQTIDAGPEPAADAAVIGVVGGRHEMEAGN